MKHSLHLLCPPSRTALLKTIKKTDPRILARLEESRKLERRLAASVVIAEHVMIWYTPIRERNNLQRSLGKAQGNIDKANANNEDDDEWAARF